VYTNGCLNSENILKYHGSEILTQNNCTRLWLITQFHNNGSLHDYLTAHTVSEHELFCFIHSAVSGLAHLHHVAFKSKLRIAHRDVNSRNILVKNDGRCCISDLGHAILDSGEVHSNAQRRVGTIRYMAPEVLDESIVANTRFQRFRLSDMYSFGLVMWEVTRRTRVIEG